MPRNNKNLVAKDIDGKKIREQYFDGILVGLVIVVFGYTIWSLFDIENFLDNLLNCGILITCFSPFVLLSILNRFAFGKILCVLAEDKLYYFSAETRINSRHNKTSVATVNPDTGLVLVQGAGTAKIRATAQDGSGKYAECTITVKAPIPVIDVDVCPTSLTMNVGDIEYLCASITPYNATNQTVTWCSSNENVATVGLYTGKVTAKKAGTTTITATTADGGFAASCTVEVCKLKIYQTKETFKFDENGCLAEDLVRGIYYNILGRFQVNINLL